MKASNAISSRKDAPAPQPRNEGSSSSTERFTLSGPSADLDPRYNAFRGDLADVNLASRLFAPHYSKPVTRECGPEDCPLRANADDSAGIVGQLQAGEGFELLDISGGWAWGYRSSDNLVGYLPAEALK